MFGEGQYTLSIPLPVKIADTVQHLILKIAEREPNLGLSKKLTSLINPKDKFHITLGVFHPGVFQTNKGLFKHIIKFLRTHKESYSEMKKEFNGKIRISGIGYDKGTIEKSQVIWASIVSPDIDRIRNKIHTLLRFSGIKDEHFIWVEPHLTLFMKQGKGDVHTVRKEMKVPLSIFGGHIDFKFDTVAISKMGKPLFSFGPNIDGKPSQKFKAALMEEIKKAQKGKVPDYNWGNLFKSPDYRANAKVIKDTLLKEGPKGLAKAGYQKDMGNIMGLLKG